MEQPKDIGTKADLYKYRLDAAKEALESSKILMNANSYKAANNRAYRIRFKKYSSRKPCKIKVFGSFYLSLALCWCYYYKNVIFIKMCTFCDIIFVDNLQYTERGS